MQLDFGGTLHSEGKKQMTILEKTCFASRAAALAMLVFAVGCNRESKPVPAQGEPAAKPMSRMEDPKYREQLKGHIAEQKVVVRDLNDIEAKMELLRRRARAAVGADATDAQVLAEIEANPMKYPEWRYLVGRRNAAMRDLKNKRADARATVLARIAKEQQSVHPAGRPPADGK